MKNCYLLILAMLSAIPSIAREGTLISISGINQISNGFSEDTAKLNHALSKTSYLLSSNLPDSALQTLRRAYPLILKYQLYDKQLEASSLLSTYYQNIGESDKAVEVIAATLERAQEIDNDTLLIQFHNIAAINYKQVGNFANSVSHYLQALELIEKKNLSQTFQAVQTAINLGIVWRRLGEKDQALHLLYNAQKQIEKNLDQKVYNGVYPYVLVNIGLVLFYSEPDRALGYFKKARTLATSNRQGYVAGFASYNINYIYLEKGMFDSVDQYLKKVKTSAFFQTERSQIQLSYLEARLALKLKQPEKALQFLGKALHLSEKTNSKDLIVGIYEDLNEAYTALGRYKNAHVYQTKLLDYIKSNQEHEKMLSLGLFHENQINKKKAENAKAHLGLQMKEKEIREKNIYIGLSIVCLVFLILFSIQVRASSKNKYQLQKEKVKSLEKNREIEKLKAIAEGEEKERMRIAYELHDGLMVKLAAVKMRLNALSYSSSKSDHTDVYQEVINQFDGATKELRNIAHNLMPDLLLQEGVAAALFYFCKSIQESSSLDISFFCFEEGVRFKQEFEISIYRMTQELVQNIIKHAEADKAIVQLNHIHHLLSITIEDDGKGFDVDKSQGGLGLKAIENRVRIFNGHFDLKSDPSRGTTAYIEFDTEPLIINSSQCV